MTADVAIAKMERTAGEYDPLLLGALSRIDLGDTFANEQQVTIAELK